MEGSLPVVDSGGSCCFRDSYPDTIVSSSRRDSSSGSVILRKGAISYIPPRRVLLTCSMVRYSMCPCWGGFPVFDLMRPSVRVCLPETNQAVWKGCVCTPQIAGYTFNRQPCSTRTRAGTYPKACACTPIIPEAPLCIILPVYGSYKRLGRSQCLGICTCNYILGWWVLTFVPFSEHWPNGVWNNCGIEECNFLETRQHNSSDFVCSVPTEHPSHCLISEE